MSRGPSKKILPISNPVITANDLKQYHVVNLHLKSTPSFDGQNKISLNIEVDIINNTLNYVVRKNGVSVYRNPKLPMSLVYYNNDFNF